LLAEDAESASEVSAPILVDVPPGVHALLADDVESLSEVSIPSLGVAGAATRRPGAWMHGPSIAGVKRERLQSDDRLIVEIVSTMAAAGLI
jgi:hypothetical protein